MTRIMLAFLALLTGLVATGAPAATRICSVDGAEVGSVAIPSAADRASARRLGVTAQAPRPEWQTRRSECPKPVRKPVYIPSVQLGIDRARE